MRRTYSISIGCLFYFLFLLLQGSLLPHVGQFIFLVCSVHFIFLKDFSIELVFGLLFILFIENNRCLDLFVFNLLLHLLCESQELISLCLWRSITSGGQLIKVSELPVLLIHCLLEFLDTLLQPGCEFALLLIPRAISWFVPPRKWIVFIPLRWFLISLALRFSFTRSTRVFIVKASSVITSLNGQSVIQIRNYVSFLKHVFEDWVLVVAGPERCEIIFILCFPLCALIIVSLFFHFFQ